MSKELVLTFKNWFYSLSEATFNFKGHPKYGDKKFLMFTVKDLRFGVNQKMKDLGFRWDFDNKFYYIFRRSNDPVSNIFNTENRKYYGFEDLKDNPNWIRELNNLGIEVNAATFANPVVEKKIQATSKNPYPYLGDSCKKILSDPEKSKIDDAFSKIVQSGRKGHIVINALAGSGKTTTLKCLWEKYGRGSNKKWLYLVFNKKNREEAKEKFIGLEDNIFTTNAFLNSILRTNNRVVPYTQYSIGTGKDKIEVARDTEEFVSERKQTSLPTVAQAKKALQHAVKNPFYKNGIYYIDRQEDLIDDASQLLADYVKQYGTDPSDEKALSERIEMVMENYDITQDIERNSYNFYTLLKSRLSSDDMEDFVEISSSIEEIDIDLKEKKEIIKKLGKWLLVHTAPAHKKLTSQNTKFTKNDRDYDYHEIRDFNDDYWYAGIFADKIDWPKYDVVLADEVQDFNHMQKVMLQKLAEKGATIVAVGDPNQALYRFRGAENTSFHDLVDTLQKDHTKNNPDDQNIVQEMPSNYRSRQAIIDYVNSKTHVKNLKRGRDYSNDNPDYHGEVTEDMKIENVAEDILQHMKNGVIDKSTALLARTNEPLALACTMLLEKGIPFTAIGANFVQETVTFFKNLVLEMGYNESTLINLFVPDIEDNDVSPSELEELGELGKYLTGQKERFAKQATKKAYLKELEKNIKTIQSICIIAKKQEPTIKTVSDVINWIRKKFKDHSISEDQVTKEDFETVILTTVHKSKGFEFDRVYLLDPSNFPHPKSRLEADLAQENNAKYVAYTRAKEELHIIDDN